MLLWGTLAGCTGGHSQRPEDLCATGEPGVICTVAGTGDRGMNGQNLAARKTWLFLPSMATFDPDGRLVFADYNNNLIRRLDDDGVLGTVAGSGMHAYALDGERALECPLENPVDMVYGSDGAMFVYEQHGARILRIDAATSVVTTWVGSAENPGYPGYSGDGGPGSGAKISEGVGLAIAGDGTLYLADTGNDAIRVVHPDGTIDTLAGNGHPGSEDGVGRQARFNQPWGIAVAGENVYVSDTGNGALRRIDRATGQVDTLVEALAGPQGLTVGPDGALYVAESDNHVVRRLDLTSGALTTVLGQPADHGFDGDGVPASESLLDWPEDVVISDEGDLYVVDTLNSRIRQVRGLAAP